ncbi:hypothetical protein LCGC14_0273310 [marine sediment metagenome]|uniref:Uncharacterized protein n=2 Tax=root TaxID=1 RepID=A0A9C9NHE8_9HYPH|nr:hypothetical protein [Aurantimonas coralicida]
MNEGNEVKRTVEQVMRGGKIVPMRELRKGDRFTYRGKEWDATTDASWCESHECWEVNARGPV